MSLSRLNLCNQTQKLKLQLKHRDTTDIKCQGPVTKIQGKGNFCRHVFFVLFFVFYFFLWGKSYLIFEVPPVPLGEALAGFYILTSDYSGNLQRNKLESFPYVPCSYGDSEEGPRPTEESSVRWRCVARVFCYLRITVQLQKLQARGEYVFPIAHMQHT